MCITIVFVRSFVTWMYVLKYGGKEKGRGKESYLNLFLTLTMYVYDLYSLLAIALNLPCQLSLWKEPRRKLHNFRQSFQYLSTCD